MFAKSGMVVGKLLTAAVLIVNTPAHAQLRWSESAYSIINSFNRMFDRLSEGDQRKHMQAVLTAVGNLDNGEFVRWYSDDSYNHGIVEIVATSQLSGRLCRRVYQTIVTEKRRDHSEYWGCMSGDGQWNFHK
jgi:surface antigen